MSRLVARLRNRREMPYGLLMLIFGAILWALVPLGVLAAYASGDPRVISVVSVYVFYAILIAIGYWVAGLAYRATAFGNMILLGPQQLPDLYAMVQAGAEELGLHPVPRTFLFNS